MIKIYGLSDSSCKLNGIWVNHESPGQSHDFLTHLQTIKIDSRLKEYIEWIDDDGE